MEIDLRSGEVCLQHNQPMRLNRARGVNVMCTAGTLWVTVNGESADIFLQAGQSWRISGDQLALVESIGSGRMRLAAPPGFAVLAAIARILKRALPRHRGMRLSRT